MQLVFLAPVVPITAMPLNSSSVLEVVNNEEFEVLEAGIVARSVGGSDMRAHSEPRDFISVLKERNRQ